MKKEIVLYTVEESEEIGRYETLWDAYRGLQEIKEFDKRNGMSGEKYYFQYEIENEDSVLVREMKIYRRGNKIYYKWVD